MADVIYRIKDWAEHYECSETKRVKSFSRYVPLPNRMDSAGYAVLINHPNGPAHYGAWVTLISVASKCEPRGTLIRGNGKPLTTETLSLMTRIPKELYEELLPRIISDEIGWMEVVDEQGNCVQTQSPFEQTRTYSNGLEQTPAEEKRREESREEERRGDEPAPASAGESSPPKEDFGDEIRDVFAHYRSYHPKSFPKPTSKMKEWTKIRDRLRDGYSVDDLKTAIDGNHSSPFHCGENAEQAKYNSLELIVRDSGKVTQFIELAQARAGPVLSQKTMRTHRAKENYLLRFGDEKQ